MPEFSGEYAKKLVDRFWAGEGIEKIAQEEDVEPSKILELMPSDDGDLVVTIPVSGSKYDSVFDVSGFTKIKTPVLKRIERAIGKLDESFEGIGVIVYIFDNVVLSPTGDGMKVTFKHYDEPDLPSVKVASTFPPMLKKIKSAIVTNTGGRRKSIRRRRVGTRRRV